MSDTKRCPHCGETKALNDFNRQGDGKQAWCSYCHKVRSREQADLERAIIARTGLTFDVWRALPREARTTERVKQRTIDNCGTALPAPEFQIEADGTVSIFAGDENLQRIKANSKAEKASKPKRTNTTVEEGFVYFISNHKAAPGETKIGKALIVNERTGGYSTSLPRHRPYKVEAYFYTPNRAEAEKAVHAFFAEWRFGTEEWFDIHPDAAIAMFNQSQLRDLLAGGTIH